MKIDIYIYVLDMKLYREGAGRAKMIGVKEPGAQISFRLGFVWSVGALYGPLERGFV